MRRLVQYTLSSLDGVGEAPGNWIAAFDDDCIGNLARVIGAQDTVLLGRGSYDDWAGYWPTADTQPFADFINGVPKYLFTSTAPTVEWAGTTVVDAPAVDFVRNLKSQTGGTIGVHGSLSLARSLRAAGLVDDIELVIFPIVAGKGRRVFGDDEPLQHLELANVRSTPSGALLVSYRDARTAPAPSA
jgi:dihydrofolate reductase